MGRLEDAERQFRAAVETAPDHPAALLGLGIVVFERGLFDEGIDLLQRAAERAPETPEIGHMLGQHLCKIGRASEGLPHLERAVALRPGFAEAHNDLGSALSALNRTEEALEQFRRAIALNAAFAEPYNNAGALLARSERHEEAIEYYKKAVASRPRYAEALVNLGISLNALGRAAEAAVTFNSAATADRNSAAAVLGHGTAMEALGRLDDARADYERAVAMAPETAAFHRALANSKTFRDADPQVPAMEALLARTPSEEDRVSLHFALGKAYDDLRRFGEAFAHWQSGNRILRARLAYDEALELESMATVARAFPHEVMQPRRGAEASQLPVFVIGMPRSGTSLVEQILASHPGVFGAGERPDFGLIAAGGYALGTNPAPITDERVREIGARYIAAVKRLAPDASRIVDKMPANFLFAGLIHLALPNARIIHVRRDPADTCFSCYAQQFQGGFAFAYDLGELGRYYRAYETLMAHWREVLPEGVMLDVDYEALVGDFEPQARRLVEHCGLPWDARCLAFHTVRRNVRTASTFQVRRPIYSSSVGRWRNYAQWLEPLTQALAVTPLGPSSTARSAQPARL